MEDAVEFSKKLQSILRFTGISNADMEKGQFRIEPNISLRTEKMEMDGVLPDYKVEKYPHLEERLGHTYTEVLAGMIIGIIISIII